VIRIKTLIHAIFQHKAPRRAFGRYAPKHNADLESHPEIALTGKAEELRRSFLLQELSFDDCITFYRLVLEAHSRFPYDWEYRILVLGLERNPRQRDLIDRIRVVRAHL
jgi:hypothetical protein